MISLRLLFKPEKYVAAFGFNLSHCATYIPVGQNIDRPTYLIACLPIC